MSRECHERPESTEPPKPLAAQPAKLKAGQEEITLLTAKETNVQLPALAALKGADRSNTCRFDPGRDLAGRRDLVARYNWQTAGEGRGPRDG